jgi:hypothetical protein
MAYEDGFTMNRDSNSRTDFHFDSPCETKWKLISCPGCPWLRVQSLKAQTGYERNLKMPFFGSSTVTLSYLHICEPPQVGTAPESKFIT